jgi:tetratricopeptide (TPR) repeat protein
MMRIVLILAGLLLSTPLLPAQVFTMHGRNWAFSAYHSPGFYGWPTGYYYQQTIIVTSPRVIMQPPRVMLPPEAPRDRESIKPIEAFDRGKLDAAVNRGDLLVIQPNKLDLAPGLEIAPPVRVPMVVLDDEVLPKEPKELAIFEVKRGRAAFLFEQYGLACERFSASIEANPNDPLPWFLLAQVQTARGQYREAVQSIQKGMKLAPDWPKAPFKLGELYAGNAKLFDEHLQKLRVAQKASKDDPLLDFLLGYHYWFLGDKSAAVKFLKAASAAVQDNAMIERFLEESES